MMIHCLPSRESRRKHRPLADALNHIYDDFSMSIALYLHSRDIFPSKHALTSTPCMAERSVAYSLLSELISCILFCIAFTQLPCRNQLVDAALWNNANFRTRPASFKITYVSQLHLIFGLLAQSHSQLCSFACKTEYEAHLRPLL